MSRYLFVHGGFHGSWCWEKTIEELKRYNVSAVALDLPGHGEDPTPRETVTLESYVSAVVEFLTRADLKSVHLVGHSLAGILIPEVATRVPERISSATFIAALVPRPGQRAIDFIPENRRERYFEIAHASPDQTLSPDPNNVQKIFFNDLSESEARLFIGKLTPQPFRPYLEAVSANPADLGIPVRYILCARDQALERSVCEESARALGVEPILLEAGHDIMLSQPVLLARTLVQAVI